MRRSRGRKVIKHMRAKALFVAGAISLPFVFNTYATNQDIADSKEKISSLEEEKKEVENTLNELEKLKSNTADYVEELDKEMTALSTRITELSGQMTDKQAEIDSTKLELEAAKEDEAEQYSSMKLRIKYMYEKGDTNFLDLIFEAESFSDMLNKAEYIQKISDYDRNKLLEFVDIREEIAATELKLEGEYAELDGMKQETEAKKSSVDALMADKKKELEEYNQRIADAQTEIDEMQQAIAAEEANIAAIEAEIKRQEEEARRKAEEAGKTYEVKSIDGISFTWPLPASSRITSNFGGRSSPTEGASSNHQGIDVGAPEGSTIKAAASGTVVISTYSKSAGNYVMINHGGGVYTVYMHMSSIAVSAGQSIGMGDTIGYVGSTGYSTGPHLHFGVRVGGSYVNPLNYVSP